MKLIYKIAIPAFLALIVVIVSFTFFSKHSLREALSREEFLKINETASKRIPQYLKADNFLEPFSPSSQKQFKDFSEELQRPSIARLTIWSGDQVIVFSDLKSIIGFHSPNHEDLKRLFAEENPFFILKTEETNEPVQAKIGEFLDIYIPIRISGKVVGALEIHAVIAAVLGPVGKHISEMFYVLITTSVLILTVVLAVVFRNIAEHKRAEEALYHKTVELERSNRVKDEFLSVMSHELRTPLNVVMGYTGMIKDGLLGRINPEQEKALEKVISEAKDQLTMISGILQATQLEAEGVKVERHKVSLRDFLNDLRSSYEVPLGKELTLKWDYPSDLPVVQTDSEKLKQILQNLINNAIKFTEKGHVSVSARCVNGTGRHVGSRQQVEGNGDVKLVEFTVVDTGVGIPKEALPVIFEKFHQVDSSETRRYGGVGIGLYIVKKFTGLLGGKVEVESEPGKGSTFTVTIPCEIEKGFAPP